MVQAISLDEVVGGRRVAMLKVDVEGFESSLLESGRASFAAALIDVLVVEVNPQAWSSFGWSMAEQAEPLVALVRDFGYRAMPVRGREDRGGLTAAFRKAGGSHGESSWEALRSFLVKGGRAGGRRFLCKALV